MSARYTQPFDQKADRKFTPEKSPDVKKIAGKDHLSIMSGIQQSPMEGPLTFPIESEISAVKPADFLPKPVVAAIKTTVEYTMPKIY